MESRSSGTHARLVCRLGAVLAALSLIDGVSPAQESVAEKPIFSILDPKLTTARVARVGPLNITAQQLLLSYEFGPAFVKKGKDPRRRHLDFMINEKLLALDAYARKAGQSARVVATLAELEGDLASEELYKDDVLGGVSVADQEVTNGVHKDRSHISLQWLFATSREQAEGLEKRLRAGAEFDSLMSEQVTDSVKRADRSLEITRFKLGETNPELAAVIDTLIGGSTSGPLKGPDGWYIIKIVNEWKDALSTESDDMKSWHDVQRVLLKRRADSLSDSYVHRLMLEKNPVIQREVLTALESFLGQQTLPRDLFAAWGMEMIADTITLRIFEGRALVSLTGGVFAVRDFRQWYKGREYNIKLPRESHEAFSAAVQQLVWRMVRDRLLISRALERHLEKRESVRTQKRWWEEKILYEMEKERIASGIPMDVESVRKYFEANRRSYRTPKGEPLPLEQVRDDVRKDYVSDELTKRMLHQLLAARKKYQVEVNTGVLEGIPVDESVERGAIDVYLVKTGGTLPRQAFPTIDLQWQAWN